METTDVDVARSSPTTPTAAEILPPKTAKSELPIEAHQEEETSPADSVPSTSSTESANSSTDEKICKNPSASTSAKKEPSIVKWNSVQTKIKPGFERPLARHGHRTLAVGNKYAVFFGGGNECLFPGLHVLDLATMEWFQPPVKGDEPEAVAAFGFVYDNYMEERLLIFGGMTEYGRYTSNLYELKPDVWEWRKLTPTDSKDPSRPNPCPRMGHSFTLINEKVVVFGGLTILDSCDVIDGVKFPLYLNDVFLLNLRDNYPHGAWETPHTYGNPPCARESHSAVAYTAKSFAYNKVIIFGGMCGHRLGDVHVLDVDTMMWSKMANNTPFSPSARSLHTATLIGTRMYVFGGWVDSSKAQQEKDQNDGKIPVSAMWKCSNNVACLNVETMMWEKVKSLGKKIQGQTALPPARAGHCAFTVGSKIFVWGGRDGYKRESGKQICLNDMWELDVMKPAAASKVRMAVVRSDSMLLEWDAIPGADSYLLQVMPIEPFAGHPTPLPNPTSTPAGTVANSISTVIPCPIPAKFARVDPSALPTQPTPVYSMANATFNNASAPMARPFGRPVHSVRPILTNRFAVPRITNTAFSLSQPMPPRTYQNAIYSAAGEVHHNRFVPANTLPTYSQHVVRVGQVPGQRYSFPQRMQGAFPIANGGILQNPAPIPTQLTFNSGQMQGQPSTANRGIMYNIANRHPVSQQQVPQQIRQVGAIPQQIRQVTQIPQQLRQVTQIPQQIRRVAPTARQLPIFRLLSSGPNIPQGDIYLQPQPGQQGRYIIIKPSQIQNTPK